MTPGGVWRGLRGLLGPGFRSRESLERYQSRCLRRLVDHAYRRVPYYRRLFDEAGVPPGRVRGVADLSLIPTTGRADIQMLPADEVCAGGWAHRAGRVQRTSGSSGAPLVVRRTALEEVLMLAFRAKAVGAWGYGPRTRRANIDHFSSEALAIEVGAKWYERFGVMPRLNLDWRLPKEQIVDRVARFKAGLVSGPPSLLADLADELCDADRARLEVTRVLTGAELLSGSMRGRIERGFGCPVVDIYGCVETVFIAMQAPGTDGYRVCGEAVIVEVLDNGTPAAGGEIVVTGLHQWSMPFIRYRLGDCVRVADGGGVYRGLREIDGRVTDRFLLSDGRRLHGYTLGQLVEQSGLGVRRFQITQVERDAFEVRLVLDSPACAELSSLRRSLRDTLGGGVRVRVEAVDSLERAGRKFYPFISYERLLSMRRSS